MSDYLHAHERAASMHEAPHGPLRGVRVIDLTRAMSGPFCTMLLADLGADVVKVEPPEGDMARNVGPHTESDHEFAYGGFFASLNRNKRSVVLDLHERADCDRLWQLLDGADVLIENFRAGVMDRLGFSFEAVHALHPRLVYAAIRGFGDPRTGASPYGEWPAFDIVAQAMGGVMSMTGEYGREPLKAGPSIGDLYPATVAALGVVAAVLHARESGEGQFVDVAMYDALVALCEAIVYRYSYRGTVTTPHGNRHFQLSPFDVYPTADGACAIAAQTPNYWEALCSVMGREDLLVDDRSRGNRERVANSEFVRAAISGWTGRFTTAEVMAQLAGVVPAGPVNTAPDLFADPHLRARDMLVAVEHAGSDRPVLLPNSPLRMTATPPGIYRRPPRLGEHNDELLAAIETELVP